MKEAKTEIKKLVIEIDGKEISLPVDKAKKLYDALGELFEKKVEIREVPTYPLWPWYWRYPPVTYDTGTPVRKDWEVYCTGNSTKFTMDNSTLRCEV